MGAAASATHSPGRALVWYRRVVMLSLCYSFAVILLSLSSVAAMVGHPYAGFFWAWHHSRGTYKVDDLSPQSADTLRPGDLILEMAGAPGSDPRTYQLAQARFEAAAALCSDRPPAETPTLSFRVLRRGEALSQEVPLRCFAFPALLRMVSLPVVLGLLIWGIGLLVYWAGSWRELNLVFVFCMAWACNVIVIEGGNFVSPYTPLGRFVSLAVVAPSPILTGAGFYHLVTLIPRQHPSRWIRKSRFLWYLAVPTLLLLLGAARYALTDTWAPWVGLLDDLAWWGIVLYVTGAALAVLLRYWRIERETDSRQARNQVRMIGLSVLMAILAVPPLVVQRLPTLAPWLPVSEVVLLFWIVPVLIVLAFSILRFQVFPGRVRGLNILVGLAVTVVVAMIASPIPTMDPETGFVALLVVLVAMGLFWALPNPVLRTLRRFASPGTIERGEIERFNDDIQGIQDLGQLPVTIVQSLERHLNLRFAALWLEQERGVLLLEAYTERAPAADLPDELAPDPAWGREPLRVVEGPLSRAGCRAALPLSAGGRLIGLIGVGERWTEEVIDDSDLAALSLMADQAALSLHTARQIRALQMVPIQIERAQLDERDRIAQDLHDSTQAELTQLSFALERLRGRLFSDPAEAELLLDGCIGDVNRAARDLRAILRDLIPERILGHTLQAILNEYAQGRQLLHPAVRIQVQVDPAVDRLLDPDRRVALLRICQQGLDNALAHAAAHKIRITLQPSGDHQLVEFSIVDDGRGFAPRPLSELVELGHHGLYLMHSRVLQAEGVIQVDATPGHGTVIKGYLPAGRNGVAAG